MTKLRYPTLLTWTDADGKTHIPPDPPLVQGYPPWFPRPNEYRRDKALLQCPSLCCRRTHACTSLLYGEYCQKTHMDRESFRAKIIVRIDAFTRKQGRTPVKWRGGVTPPPPPEMKRILAERQEYLIREALLEWQKGWIAKQQKQHAKRAARRIGAPE